MYIIQIFLIVFFLIAIVKVIGRYRTHDLSAGSAFFWLLFWVIAGIIVITPNSTAYFAKIVGIGRGADLVVYIALSLIFFMFFRLMVKVERMNKDITTLTRKIALDESRKTKSP